MKLRRLDVLLKSGLGKIKVDIGHFLFDFVEKLHVSNVVIYVFVGWSTCSGAYFFNSRDRRILIVSAMQIVKIRLLEGSVPRLQGRWTSRSALLPSLT